MFQPIKQSIFFTSLHPGNKQKKAKKREKRGKKAFLGKTLLTLSDR
jgi:hypothetical protein